MPNKPSTEIEFEELVKLFPLLSLCAADQTVDPVSGKSYDKLESESQSKSHEDARKQAIKYFNSLGYSVYPKGVGIQGTFTFSDFAAVKGSRLVFGECLTDSNIKRETLARKRQLEAYGELCFIFLTGSKISDTPELRVAKNEVSKSNDVLLYNVHGYSGGHINEPKKLPSVAFETSDRKIWVELKFINGKKEYVIQIKFLTRPYSQMHGMPISHPSMQFEELVRTTLLKSMEAIGRSGKWIVSSEVSGAASVEVALKKKSGLKVWGNGRKTVASARLDGELGIVALHRCNADSLDTMFAALKDFGLSLEMDIRALEDFKISLSKCSLEPPTDPNQRYPPVLREKLKKGNVLKRI